MGRELGVLCCALPGEGQFLSKPSRLEIGDLCGQVVSAEGEPATPAGKVLEQGAGVLPRLADSKQGL